jgi:hypothetical protein
MLTINIVKHYGVDIEGKARENLKKDNISNVEFVLSTRELMDKT